MGHLPHGGSLENVAWNEDHLKLCFVAWISFTIWKHTIHVRVCVHIHSFIKKQTLKVFKNLLKKCPQKEEFFFSTLLTLNFLIEFSRIHFGMSCSFESEVAQLRPTLCHPMDTRLLHPWDFLGKSTGVGCHFLLQGIFPTQGSNPGLPAL